MKIKDFIELCEDDYCSISVYDKSTFSRKLFKYPQEVVDKYGYFSLLGWKIENSILKITTQTEF